MYSEADLDNAVQAGVLNAGAAAGFRAFVAARRDAPAVDEEYFKLLTGFNDIFVSIAIVLVLAGAGALANLISHFASAIVVAGASWGLAEYFTRQRRLALPSILLMFSFGAATTLLVLIIDANVKQAIGFEGDTSWNRIIFLVGTLVTVAAIYFHWRRFKVPITVAAGCAVAVALLWILQLLVFKAAETYALYFLLIAGLLVFAVALCWDFSDRTRTTRRADVAFWLHLLAAPLIVHPLFAMLGLLRPQSNNIAHALVAIAIYAVFTIVALLIDRRAILVSALAYVLGAIYSVLHAVGTIGTGLALTGLVAGAALLLLSVLWHRARTLLLSFMPNRFQGWVPVA